VQLNVSLQRVKPTPQIDNLPHQQRNKQPLNKQQYRGHRSNLQNMNASAP
jgi:hypothetical protein